MPEPGSYVKVENFSARYANNVRFDLTVWDISIFFGELAKIPGGSDLYVEQHTSITMSWLQAKLLAAFLFLNINQYEAANGPIRVPEGVLPPALNEDESGLSLTDMFSKVVERASHQQDEK